MIYVKTAKRKYFHRLVCHYIFFKPNIESDSNGVTQTEPLHTDWTEKLTEKSKTFTLLNE